MEKEIWFDGPCPFLTCLETGRHSHPICPECGAVRYGNLDCPTCRGEMAKECPVTIRKIEEALEGAR